MIYLDNAATTKPADFLRDILIENTFNCFGNPGSLHSLGFDAKTAISDARKSVAKSVGAQESNVIFTSGGSEANTLAILGLEKHLRRRKLYHIITTNYEHSSVYNAMRKLEDRGFTVTYLPVEEDGTVSVEKLENSFKNDTGLVSIMYVNNELGTINNCPEIYKLCKSKGVIFHSDCVQAYGAIPIAMNKVADIITASAHKVHALKGTGFLCATSKELFEGIICGGEQEFGVRPGTENVAGIVCLGKVAEKLSGEKFHVSKITDLREAFGVSLFWESQKLGVQYYYNVRGKCLPKILSIRFPGVDAATLLFAMSNGGVCASAGAACSSNSLEPSRALKAIGLSDEDARSTIRISFSRDNTEEEVTEAAKIIAKNAHDLICFDKNIRR